jgi:hypothetical protein
MSTATKRNIEKTVEETIAEVESIEAENLQKYNAEMEDLVDTIGTEEPVSIKQPSKPAEETKPVKNPSYKANGVSIPGGFSTITFLSRVIRDLNGVKALNPENEELNVWANDTIAYIESLKGGFKTAPAARTANPAAILKNIEKLTPEQKAELLKSLS